MAVSRKRKNRGKGIGAKERRRRIAQHNAELRERFREQNGRYPDIFERMWIRGLK